MSRLIPLLVILAGVVTTAEAQEASDPLLTVAESSDWKGTARHAEVIEFLDRLRAESSVVRLSSMGRSAEGRSIPLVILSNPPVASAAEARRLDRLVVYAQGGIHSGECCGKEALLMLAREISRAKESKLLDDLVILFAPIYNPDGNERVRKDNRRGQAGPELGMGQRATSEGYDLNRDNTKLDSPAAQALARLLNRWDPAVVIDTHTTNGSYHQNTLTFDGPVNPAGDARLIDFTRKSLLPSVSTAVEKRTGYLTTFYGNSNRTKDRWSTYDGTPRFGTRQRGIRGIVSVLTEAYKYASYRDRVLCTRDVVRATLEYAAAHRSSIRKMIDDVRRDTVEAGKTSSKDDKVSIRCRIAELPEPIAIHGYVEKVPEGATGRRARSRPTKEKKTYRMRHFGAYESTLDVVRPVAYVYPRSIGTLTTKLRQHGIDVRPVEKVLTAAGEIYRVDSVQRARRPYQGHRMATVEVTGRQEDIQVTRDEMIVFTASPLGNLIVYLLEPMAEDGLTTWNVLDGHFETGDDFPIRRVMKFSTKPQDR